MHDSKDIESLKRQKIIYVDIDLCKIGRRD